MSENNRKGTSLKQFLKRSIAAALVAAVGCAGTTSYQKAKDEESLGHYDLAVMNYAKALQLDPGNSGYKATLARARLKASQFHFEKGKMYATSGRPDLAVVELEQAALLDPTNDYAATELRKAREAKARQDAEKNTETNMERIKKKTKGARAVATILEPASDKPINLNFPQQKPIKQIYRALADAAGINVIFDPQLKDDNVSIVLSNIEFQKALETLIRQENHFYKIIDTRTILIAADTPQNRKTYEDLVIRTFFLSNADVTEVANALRALLQTTRISINKAENSVTLRDTADKVAVAERIVEQNDKQVSEVVVDVELLQINTGDLQDLGLELTPRSISASIPAPGGVTNLNAPLGAGQFNWSQLQQIAISSVGFTIPSATLTFIKDNTNAELLAKPQLRISEGQKAQLLIGSKVPVPVTQFQSVGAGVGSAVTSPVTSYQYQDIGIKIEVEPRVHHNKEVTLKLMVEVSNQEGNAVGTTQPQFGTRTISSNIRLKDGETNFLAGLYRLDKSDIKHTIPFIGDIPIVGLLFNHNTNDHRTTDLVLTLTPHIIRIPDVTEEDVTPYFVGTDSNISYQGGPRVENPTRDNGPFEQQPGAGAKMPPSRAPAAQQQQQPSAPPIAAPGSGPTDIFRPAPAPPPPGAPQAQVPPQASLSSSPATGAVSAKSEAADTAPEQVLFDFDPSYVTLAVGAQQSILVRATSAAALTGGTVALKFDPAVVAAVVVRPILGSGTGVADAVVQKDHVVIQFPSAEELGGTRALAEITLRGIAPGRSALAFEPTDLSGAAVSSTPSVIDVK
jgi:general secretion pathway protein D